VVQKMLGENRLHCESKNKTPYYVDNFAKNCSTYKIFSLIDAEQNFLPNK